MTIAGQGSVHVRAGYTQAALMHSAAHRHHSSHATSATTTAVTKANRKAAVDFADVIVFTLHPVNLSLVQANREPACLRARSTAAYFRAACVYKTSVVVQSRVRLHGIEELCVHVVDHDVQRSSTPRVAAAAQG